MKNLQASFIICLTLVFALAGCKGQISKYKDQITRAGGGLKKTGKTLPGCDAASVAAKEIKKRQGGAENLKLQRMTDRVRVSGKDYYHVVSVFQGTDSGSKSKKAYVRSDFVDADICQEKGFGENVVDQNLESQSLCEGTDVQSVQAKIVGMLPREIAENVTISSVQIGLRSVYSINGEKSRHLPHNFYSDNFDIYVHFSYKTTASENGSASNSSQAEKERISFYTVDTSDCNKVSFGKGTDVGSEK